MRSLNVERNNVVRKIDAVQDAGGTIFCVIFAQPVHCELLNQLQNLASVKNALDIISGDPCYTASTFREALWR